jgi:hypothetical protein
MPALEDGKAVFKPDEKETSKMKRIVYFRFAQLALLALMLSLNASAVRAQTTSFTYQGSLNDGGSPANGPYDLQFKLFDALSGGAQQGSTISRDDIQVTNGVFSVTLDFGAAAFPGASRFLEISVRPGASTGAYTILSPRQQITSTPYAIKSLGAATADGLSTACVNCVVSSQIGSLPAGSGSYIQNTTSQQSSANFNISGNGTAGGTLNAATVNATTQYNLGGSRALSAPGMNNLFAGLGAGQVNTTGSNNAFFGSIAGQSNTIGGGNSFFGRNAGGSNSTGSGNSLFGFSAGGANSTGFSNSFFGFNAGAANTTGNNNTVIGAGANVATGGLSFATAIGAGAVASASNTVVLGRNLDAVSVPGNLTVAGTLTSTLPSGSANYIQNTTAPQSSANFNISGNGTVGGTLSAGAGVTGSSTATNGRGVIGQANNGTQANGVFGTSTSGSGVRGDSASGTGVFGQSQSGTAVFGFSNSGGH